MMAYNNSYVCSVMTSKDYKNTALRELQKEGKRTCILPFGTEYFLRLKNKKGTRCMVEVSIDGTDVLFGSRLIMNPYQTLDLERFLDNNQSGAKFKFMSIDQAASTGELNDPSSPENGRIQVRFYEETQPSIYLSSPVLHTVYGGGVLRGMSSMPFIGYCNTVNTNGTAVGNSTTTTNTGIATNTSGVGVTGQATGKGMSCSVNATNATMDSMGVGMVSGVEAAPQEAAGVTGQGGVSNQGFVNGSWFPTDSYPTTIDIWLSGPIKVEAKPQAPFYTVKRVGQEYQVLANGQPIAFQSFEISEKGLLLQVAQGLIETKNFNFAG